MGGTHIFSFIVWIIDSACLGERGQRESLCSSICASTCAPITRPSAKTVHKSDGSVWRVLILPVWLSNALLSHAFRYHSMYPLFSISAHAFQVQCDKNENHPRTYTELNLYVCAIM